MNRKTFERREVNLDERIEWLIDSGRIGDWMIVI